MAPRIGGRLVDARTGARVDLRTGRGPRVIFVTHDTACAGCAAWLERLEAERAAFADWGGRLTVVIDDADARVALGVTAAALLIVDEWGEVFFTAEGGAGHALPDSTEVIEWIRFIAVQCPECEQPEGEWRSVP